MIHPAPPLRRTRGSGSYDNGLTVICFQRRASEVRVATEVEVINPALHVAGARHVLDPGEARAGSVAQAAERADSREESAEGKPIQTCPLYTQGACQCHAGTGSESFLSEIPS